jgi:hypothetical protein
MPSGLVAGPAATVIVPANAATALPHCNTAAADAILILNSEVPSIGRAPQIGLSAPNGDLLDNPEPEDGDADPLEVLQKILTRR